MVKKILKQINTRAKLLMSLPSYFKSVIRSFKFCRWWKADPLTQSREQLFRNGKIKIDKELDIRHISKELRTLRFIARVLLTKPQRFMIPYFKENLLNDPEF
jgi:hypothetical protein